MSIGFALAIPFVGLAFSIDEIGHGIVKVLSMGRAGRESGGAGHGVTAFGKRWKPSRRFFAPGIITLAFLITGLVMVLVWTSSLGTQSKVTVTVCFGIFFVLISIGRGLIKLFDIRHVGGSVTTSSWGESQSIAEP